MHFVMKDRKRLKRLVTATVLSGVAIAALAGAAPTSWALSAVQPAGGAARTVTVASPITITSTVPIAASAATLIRLHDAGARLSPAVAAEETAAAHLVAYGTSPQLVLCEPVTIRSAANNEFASAELGYVVNDPKWAMLRARATVPLFWQDFSECRDTLTFRTVIECQACALPGAAFHWVSAELGYTGDNYAMLRARATSIGPWEEFYTTHGPCLGLCMTTIRSGANNLYVSAELGYTGDNYGMLRARTASAGPWENFYW